MKDFLKRNFVLVLGLSLPLLLIVSLLLMHGITRMLAEKPAYPVLYVAFDTTFAELYWDIDIDDAGRLDLGFRLPEDGVAHTRRHPADATIALYDAAEGELTTFRLDAPDNPPLGERVEIGVPEALAERVFDDSVVAPDGYRLQLGGYGGGGLLGELFASGRRPRHHRLVSDGASIRVPDVDSRARAYRYDAFLGWEVRRNE